MQVVLDFESRSATDLRSRGVWPYAHHPSTQIMCLSVAVNAAAPLVYVPMQFQRLINVANLRYELITEPRLFEIIQSADEIVAFNSFFEFLMWNYLCVPRYNWPKIPLEKIHDVQAQCAMCALPLNLEQAGEALGLSVLKDKTGHKVMMKLSRPRTPRKAEKLADPDWVNKVFWHEDPKDIETLINYCGKDVEAERVIYHRLPKLPAKERQIWLLDQKINLRGVHIDVENVKAIVKVVAEREQQQLTRFAELTNGVVSGPRSYVALKNWVNERVPGIDVESVDKNAAAELLARTDIDDNVRQVLQIKAELSKSSVAKFRSMLDKVGDDNRIRGLFKYHTASTGRWGSVGVQVQNLVRDSYGPQEYEGIAELFRAGDIEGMRLLYDDPFIAASKCIRGSLCAPPGSQFICSDFSAIEARGVAWLAGEETLLDTFRTGKDVYKVAAMGIFGVAYEDVTKEQRQIGKVAILSMSYNGGIGAYASMAKNYGIDLEQLPPLIMPTVTNDETEGLYGAYALARNYLKQNPGAMSFEAAVSCDIIKRRWRVSNSNIVRLWKGLDMAARQAVLNPGQVFAYRLIKYVVHDSFLKCMLPSGRMLYYYKPAIREIKPAWEEDEDITRPTITYEGLRIADGATTRQWTRLATFGGRFCENVTSAICRDLLAEAMLRLENAGYPIVLHVHDEAAAETLAGYGSLDEFNALMSARSYWAAGMPIAAEGWIDRRYHK